MADGLVFAAPVPPDDADITDVVGGIRRLIDTAGLDCLCRKEIEHLLLQFELLAADRHRQRSLDLARGQRRRIAAIVELLRELDEIGYEEIDGSVLAEAHLLFEDIAEAARHGADILAEPAQSRSQAGALA